MFIFKNFKNAIFIIFVSFVGFVDVRAEDNITKAQAELPTEDLTIITKDGKENHFIVEVARTEREQEIGEMFRKTIKPSHGMLFIWSSPHESAMWMRNTYVSLDMIFIDEGHRVHAIEEDTVPLSEGIISSHGVVSGVLELPSGTAERLGILVGDKVKAFSLR